MSLLTRYLVVAVALVGAFTNFIACGAQMYKASLNGDHQAPQQPAGAQLANSTDPTSPEYGLNAPSGWAALPIHYKTESRMNSLQVAALQAAMKTWETATGRSLFFYDGVQSGVIGDSFPDLNTSLADSINGNYLRNDWKKTGKDNNVLATTIWNNPSGGDYHFISSADIHYNTGIYYISDALKNTPVDGREIVDMQSLATHELGHFLGLAHIPEVDDASSIMNPSLMIGTGIATRAISVGDIQRIQKIYGCQNTACDVQTTARTILQASQFGLAENNSSH